MAIIRAGMGSWMLPTSRHKPLKGGDQIKVGFRFEPFLCIQETGEQPRMTSLAGFLYELHGVVLAVNQSSWKIWCGIPLVCEQTPYPWLFEGQQVQVFAKLVMYFDPLGDSAHEVTIRNISSQLSLFKHVQVDQNKRISPGATTHSTREEITRYGAQHPPVVINEIPFPRSFSGIDYFCFDVELSSSNEKKHFY